MHFISLIKVLSDVWPEKEAITTPSAEKLSLLDNTTRCRPSKGRRCIPDVDI